MNGLGDGGLAACADRVSPAPLGRRLFGPVLRLDLLERLWHQEDVTALAFDVAGAFESVDAFAAGLAWEEHGEPGVAVAECGLPWWTRHAVGAGQGAGLPVDVEVLLGEAGPFTGLWVVTDWSEECDVPMLGGVVDAVRRDVAAVNDVFGGLEPLRGQSQVDPVEGVDVLLGQPAGW